MWHKRLSRRQLLAVGGTAFAAKLLGISLAETPIRDPIRIGAVFPTRTGQRAVLASLYDFVGEAARMGALLGEDDMSAQAGLLGMQVDVLPASSPSAEAAYRAGQRLVATEEVGALIGGLGEGQAEVLAAVAEEHGIPFFNIGSPSDALRQEACSRYTFHVEASAAMYLDALVGWFASSGHGRWFIVHEDSDEGMVRHRRALEAIAQHQAGVEVVGEAAVVPEQPVYVAELDAAHRADADVILLLLDARDQIAFLANYDSMDFEVAIAPFPDPVTQSREYFATTQHLAPRVGSGKRTTLWETTLETNGAEELNDRFMSRWGEPMDPPGWAAYAATKILYETVVATGTLESSALVDYLENPEAVFDVHKGPGVSFRPWDHQLRQPLYLVEIDPEAEWGLQLSRKVGVANLVGELPALYLPEADPIERLDQLGDGPEASSCRF